MKNSLLGGLTVAMILSASIDALACTTDEARQNMITFVKELAAPNEKITFMKAGARKVFNPNTGAINYDVAVTFRSSRDGGMVVFATLDDTCEKAVYGPKGLRVRP